MTNPARNQSSVLFESDQMLVIQAENGKAMWTCLVCGAHSPVTGFARSSERERAVWLADTKARAANHARKYKDKPAHGGR